MHYLYNDLNPEFHSISIQLLIFKVLTLTLAIQMDLFSKFLVFLTILLTIFLHKVRYFIGIENHNTTLKREYLKLDGHFDAGSEGGMGIGIGIEGGIDCRALRKRLRKLMFDDDDAASARNYIPIYLKHCIPKSNPTLYTNAHRYFKLFLNHHNFHLETETEWLTRLNTEKNKRIDPDILKILMQFLIQSGRLKKSVKISKDEMQIFQIE